MVKGRGLWTKSALVVKGYSEVLEMFYFFLFKFFFQSTAITKLTSLSQLASYVYGGKAGIKIRCFPKPRSNRGNSCSNPCPMTTRKSPPKPPEPVYSKIPTSVQFPIHTLGNMGQKKNPLVFPPHSSSHFL